MKIELAQVDDILSRTPLGNTLTFLPEAYKYAEERSRNSEAYKKYGYGCAFYDLYQSDVSEAKEAVQNTLSLGAVRLIVWACLFGSAGIIILAVILFQKRRLKQE